MRNYSAVQHHPVLIIPGNIKIQKPALVVPVMVFCTDVFCLHEKTV